MMELKFRADTKHRKDWFTGVSFSHPAKMSLPLQLWIIENYTKAGDIVLDPMAGSGTILVACSLGRNVIAVELEQKFIDIMNGNWEKIKQRGAQLGYTFGQAQIIQGDCRNLEGILANAIVTSPPYAESMHETGSDEFKQKKAEYAEKHLGGASRTSLIMRHSGEQKSPDNIANLPYGQIDKIVTSPPYAESQVPPHTAEGEARRLEIAKERGVSPDKVSYMDYTKVNSIITSPPYAEAHDTKNLGVGDGDRADLRAYSWLKEDNPSNIGNLRYGNISHIVTSPPYEATVKRGDESPGASGKDRPTYQERIEQTRVYSNEGNNIGNLKGDTYLEAMLQVYQSCFAVLCDGGLMILVVKNFLREQKEVDLRGDTQQLAERAGFSFVEEHHRILPAQSFWRVIYTQRFPNAPKIDREFVLVFRKSGGDE